MIPGTASRTGTRPGDAGGGRVQDLIVALAEDPQLLAAFQADPGPYLGYWAWTRSRPMRCSTRTPD